MNVTPPQLRPPGPAGFIRPAPRDNRAAENNQTSNKLGRPRLAFHRGGTMKARLSRNQGNEKRGHVRAAESWPRISRQTSWPSRARITQSAESSSSIECTPNLPEARWGDRHFTLQSGSRRDAAVSDKRGGGGWQQWFPRGRNSARRSRASAPEPSRACLPISQEVPAAQLRDKSH